MIRLVRAMWLLHLLSVICLIVIYFCSKMLTAIAILLISMLLLLVNIVEYMFRFTYVNYLHLLMFLDYCKHDRHNSSTYKLSIHRFLL